MFSFFYKKGLTGINYGRIVGKSHQEIQSQFMKGLTTMFKKVLDHP